MFLYYSLGTTLERVWGTFRFNLYFFSGILFHIIAAFVIYFLMGVSVPLTPFYLNNSLFLAFAATFPQMQFYLYGLLPIRAYWLGIFIGAEFLYEFLFGGLIARICIGLALLNFVIFFMMTNILEQSTDLICDGQGAEQLAAAAFHLREAANVVKLPGVVSRKKQLIPGLMIATEQ